MEKQRETTRVEYKTMTQEQKDMKGMRCKRTKWHPKSCEDMNAQLSENVRKWL